MRGLSRSEHADCGRESLASRLLCTCCEVGAANRGGFKVKAQKEHAAHVASAVDDARRQPRFKLAVAIIIHSRTCGMLNGHTVDISESGIAAMLTIEASVGEVVDLNFTLPLGPVTIQAIVRQRNAFRYGFEFIATNPASELVRRTCRDLAVNQSLILPPLQT